MNIRNATDSDIPSIVGMSANFYKVAGYDKHIPFCPDSTAEYVKVALDMEMVCVAENDQQVVGFVLGIIAPFIMNRNYLSGCELAWWVEPEHRTGSAGIKLLKAIEQKAEKLGVKIWSMMCLESQEPEKVESMYLKLGYTKAERTFTRVF